METIGQRVKRLLSERHMSNRDLVRALAERGHRVSPGTINNLVNDKRQTRSETLRAIAEFFGISLDELLGKDEVAGQETGGIERIKRVTDELEKSIAETYKKFGDWIEIRDEMEKNDELPVHERFPAEKYKEVDTEMLERVPVPKGFTGSNFEAYKVTPVPNSHGLVWGPNIPEIVIVDRDATPKEGNCVLCEHKGNPIVGFYSERFDSKYVMSGQRLHKLGADEAIAVIARVIKNFPYQ